MISIVYVTNTGSSKAYAQMLSEKTGYAAYSLADSGSVPEESEVIFIGWVMAGSLQGLKEARERFGNLKAVIAVGMMKSEKQDKDLKEKNGITEPFFSLPGAFDMKKLTGMHKMMMGMMVKMMKSKLKETDDPKAKEVVEKFEEGFDMIDEKHLSEVLEFLG
ncbi:MAG: hypothetical protein IJW86_09270 [Clostridia bacterium]|nr:hypothetical protein [Clostridia bacterium]